MKYRIEKTDGTFITELTYLPNALLLEQYAARHGNIIIKEVKNENNNSDPRS